MRRILLVFEPPDGGVAENVMRLALGLREQGWEPSVAGPEDSMVYPALQEAGIPIVRLTFQPGFRHVLADTGSLVRLIRLIRGGSFDLVHAHSAKAGVLARLAANACRTPVVYSPHCFPFVGPWGRPRRQFALSLERTLAKGTAAIVCAAAQERELGISERVAPPERLHVVRGGTPSCDGAFKPDPALAAFRGEGPLAACLTVLRAQKSVHVFVEAARRVLDAVPEARLAVVGSGPLRVALEAQARPLMAEGRFAFFDFLPPSHRQLKDIDVFVLPSSWEALPISVLEAMSCGVPQLATDVGGTSEAVEDGVTGMLCPPGDPDALADRLIELLRDAPLRERMGQAAARRHAERFSLERLVKSTAAVYDQVVAR